MNNQYLTSLLLKREH